MLKSSTGALWKTGRMAVGKYSLILTRSVHAISADAALKIKCALESGDRTVEVTLRFFNSEERPTFLNTAHIIAVAEEPRAVLPEYDGNVLAFRAAGSASR